MQVTYIYHSGFLVELESMYLLFDYYKGQLGDLKINKPLFVLASHAHQDHFNPKVYELTRSHETVRYILSADIKLTERKCKRENLLPCDLERTTFIKGGEHQEFKAGHASIHLTTFHSTDRGVAFLVEAEGKVLYHAGDFNWWIWKEEEKMYNNNMTTRFLKEVEMLRGVKADVAFLPLDPRQECYYANGMEKYLEVMQVSHVFAMHMWDQYSVIDQYKKEYGEKEGTRLYSIQYANQIFQVEE